MCTYLSQICCAVTIDEQLLSFCWQCYCALVVVLLLSFCWYCYSALVVLLLLLLPLLLLEMRFKGGPLFISGMVKTERKKSLTFHSSFVSF